MLITKTTSNLIRYKKYEHLINANLQVGLLGTDLLIDKCIQCVGHKSLRYIFSNNVELVQ